ncbi:hypothetical protein V6N13_059321 [Hibiscus sabdariffa]
MLQDGAVAVGVVGASNATIDGELVDSELVVIETICSWARRGICPTVIFVLTWGRLELVILASMGPCLYPLFFLLVDWMAEHQMGSTSILLWFFVSILGLWYLGYKV